MMLQTAANGTVDGGKKSGKRKKEKKCKHVGGAGNKPLTDFLLCKASVHRGDID
jgi:hypothetical protein